MSYSVFSANWWIRIWCYSNWFQTKTAHYHQTCPFPLLKPPWLIVNDQWSILFLIHSMDLYNQYLIPTIYSHAAQKVGLNSFPPNSAPSETAFHRSNPSWGAASVSVSSGFPVPVGSSSGMEGLSWSRCRVEKRKVGWATVPQVGEKVNIHPMLEDGEGWWRFLRLRYYSTLFPCKNSFPLEYTRCHIQYSPPIYESKFGVTTTDFRPKQHTTTKHAHIHFWSLHG